MDDPQIGTEPRRLHVVLDVESDGDDMNAIIAAISLLRGVKCVEPALALGAETPVGQLGLSARPLNALTAARVTTIGELTARSRSELQRVKNLGRLGLHEIEQKLTSIGGRLRLELQKAAETAP